MDQNAKGQIVGYVRVSTVDQNPDSQLYGIELDRKFIDKASGKSTNRPEFTSMMKYVREGDTIIVRDMSRLSRTLIDLISTVKELNSRGVAVKFIKEGLTFTGEGDHMAHLMLAIMGAVAEFERAIILERQKEGIALAKIRGMYKKGPKVMSQEKIEEAGALIKKLGNKSKAARELGISRETLRKYCKLEQVYQEVLPAQTEACL